MIYLKKSRVYVSACNENPSCILYFIYRLCQRLESDLAIPKTE